VKYQLGIILSLDTLKASIARLSLLF